MPIIAIDPGNVQSGYCVIDQKTLRPLEFGKIDNEELLKKLESAAKQGWRWAVIEMVASYGMSVGRDVFDTTFWIGRFYQVLSSWCPVRMMCRIEEKKHICHDSRANDTAIRRALIDRFAAHDLKNGKGTKKAPDFFYGFKADVWAAPGRVRWLSGIPKSCGLRMITPSSSGIAGLRPHNRQDCLKCPVWSWKWTKGNSCKP